MCVKEEYYTRGAGVTLSSVIVLARGFPVQLQLCVSSACFSWSVLLFPFQTSPCWHSVGSVRIPAYVSCPAPALVSLVMWQDCACCRGQYPPAVPGIWSVRDIASRWKGGFCHYLPLVISHYT